MIQRDVMMEMYRLTFNSIGLFCFILIFNLVFGKNCDPHDLTNTQCPETQCCEEAYAICQCCPGYVLHNVTHCIKLDPGHPYSKKRTTVNYPNDNHSNGSIVAGILIPLFLILFVICGVYLSRKYQLYSWVRRKLSQRNTNYDEFMIGQDVEDDDPPLR